jgi:hypothetical protein
MERDQLAPEHLVPPFSPTASCRGRSLADSYLGNRCEGSSSGFIGTYTSPSPLMPQLLLGDKTRGRGGIDTNRIRK